MHMTSPWRVDFGCAKSVVCPGGGGKAGVEDGETMMSRD